MLFLAVAPSHAANLTENLGLSPQGYVCKGENVTLSGKINWYGYYSTYGQGGLTTVSASNGETYEFNLSVGGDWINLSFTTSNFNDNVMTISVVVDGEQICSFSIDVVRVTSVVAYAGGETTQAVAIGQRADFQAVLNTYAGNSADWGPECLIFNNATLNYTNSSWAHNTWTEPGTPTVVATLGNSSADCTIYVVNATIRSVTFTGDGFANVLRDTDGTAYPTPHYSHAQPGDASPVQYRRGSRPTMNLVFDVEPVTYPGIVKIKAASNLETPIVHNNACAGDLYLNSVQTTESLPDDVGHQDLEMNWEFSVAADAFYSAGTSTNRIYRTLGDPQPRFHTSVDVACRNVSGTDAGTVIANIWAKYESLNVQTFDGHTMTYYRNGSNTPDPNLPFNQALYNPQGNLQYDGRCGHWAEQFHDVLSVHGIESTVREIRPRPVNSPLFFRCLPDSLVVSPNLVAQGGTSFTNTENFPIRFVNHAVVTIENTLYDPSYGSRYVGIDLEAARANWESCVYGTYHYVYTNPDPNVPPELRFFLNLTNNPNDTMFVE